MLVLKSLLLQRFPEIQFGFSTKVDERVKEPFHFNVSLSVGDDKETVIKNRKKFFNSIGLEIENVAYQKQIHTDIINYVDKGGYCGESDAMITDKIGIGLAISTADCTPIFVYDKNQKVIAGIHSGWRSTKLRILEKTITQLQKSFNSDVNDLFVYIGPSISCKNYEFGSESLEFFEPDFILKKENKYFLDVAGINYKILLEAGIPRENIQYSKLCTFDNSELLHSYRREGVVSGRALGVIAMKGKNERK